MGRKLLGDYWNVIFCSLETEDRLYIHAQTHTHIKSSRAKSFIIQLS